MRIPVVFKNFLSLGSVQVVNYLLPLIVTPYITRTIGLENFGIVSFMQSVVAYSTLLVNFGFEWSATRAVSQNRDNPVFLNQLFNQIFYTRLFLILLSGLILAIITPFQGKLSLHGQLLFITFLVNVGFVMPTWLYQGLERMGEVAIINFILKLLLTLPIFIFVHQPSDYPVIPLTITIGQILVGWIVLWRVIQQMKFQLFRPDFAAIKQLLLDSLPIFLSTLMINLYLSSQVVFLGIFTNNYQTSLYAAAYKLIMLIVIGVFQPLNTALFPFIGKKFAISPQEGMRAITPIFYGTLLVSISLSIFVFIFAGSLLSFLGIEYLPAVPILRCLAVLPILLEIQEVFAIHGLLNLTLDKLYFKLTCIAAILGLCLNYWLIPTYFAMGGAIALVLPVALVAISAFVILYSKGYKLYGLRILLKNLGLKS